MIRNRNMKNANPLFKFQSAKQTKGLVEPPAALVFQAFFLAALACAGAQSASAQYAELTLTNGYVQVQGDIITTQERAARLLAEMRGDEAQPQFVYYPSRLWPNRTVPYDFDPGVT